MEGKIFILTFERCGRGCCDEEYRVCIAGSEDLALQIAKEHRDRYFKGWSYWVTTPDWSDDNTAYVTSRYS